jgi:hypothetical protein
MGTINVRVSQMWIQFKGGRNKTREDLFIVTRAGCIEPTTLATFGIQYYRYCDHVTCNMTDMYFACDEHD